MKGRSKKGSKESSVPEVIGEGLSLDRRMRIGQRLGCMAFAMCDSKLLECPSASSSVATLSSLIRKGWSAGYLHKKIKDYFSLNS
jgi:hypothetical protein